MGKYVNAEEAVFSVFGSAEWAAETTKAFPTGFKGEKGEPPFLRLALVPNGEGLNRRSTSGVLMIEIFTAWGKGPRESSLIADKLDTFLQSKTVGTTQFFESSLGQYLQDKDDETLGRAIYSLPFAHFGAL